MVADQLDVLVDTLGSDRKAGAFVGLSHTQFGAWRRGAPPSQRSLTRIADGVAVIDLLRAHGLAPDEIRGELLSVWAEVGERPAALVASGKTKTLLDAIPVRFASGPSTKPLESPVDLVAALRALATAAAASADALTKEVS
jgi:hypothetical protein